MNSRLIDPPVIDVSVSRHMGLFAVAPPGRRAWGAGSAARGSPQGLTALVWLPDSLIEQEPALTAVVPNRRARSADFQQADFQQADFQQADFQQADFQAKRTTGRHSVATRSAADGQSANGLPDAIAASAQAAPAPSETLPTARSAMSSWFRSRRPFRDSCGRERQHATRDRSAAGR